MHLTDRASLLKSTFRLLDTDPQDPEMIEFDDEPLEGIYGHLQQGADDAQSHLISVGASDWWLERSSVLVFRTEPNGERSAPLPDDFRRLHAEDEFSPLESGDQGWGIEIPAATARRAQASNAFYLRRDRLWVTRQANVPNNLTMNYVRRMPVLADGTDVDFPEADRGLIVAYAALAASAEHWFTGGMEGRKRIMENLQARKRTARTRARRTSQPQKVRTPVVMPHYALIQ